jgi:hypothetical protein
VPFSTELPSTGFSESFIVPFLSTQLPSAAASVVELISSLISGSTALLELVQPGLSLREDSTPELPSDRSRRLHHKEPVNGARQNKNYNK